MHAVFVAFLLLVVSHPANVSAAPLRAAPLQTTPNYEQWDTDKLHQYGNDLLRRGRTFERAIDALSIAARREPKNLEYQLALGCACASRFASVAYALHQSAEFSKAQEVSRKRRAKWEEAQSDPSRGDTKASPPPKPPTPPITPDDRRRFEMSKEDARLLLLRLGQKSAAAFEAAQRLAEDAPPERQAERSTGAGGACFFCGVLATR